MASTGSSGKRAEPEATQEFTIRVGLVALDWVPDDVLEDLTMRVEDALSADAAEIAPGASASANFGTRTIELDLIVDSTPSAVHALVGEVVRIAMASFPDDEQAPVSFGSSNTSALAYA